VPDQPSQRRSVALARGAVSCALLVVLTGCGTGPVEVDGTSPPSAQRASCEALVADLPATVADLERRDVEPSDALAAAWGDPAIVLTCGVGRPDDYDPAAGCTTVDGIDWYVPLPQLGVDDGEQDLTMTTINRDVAVRVELPGEHWPPASTLVDLSDAVEEHTEARGRCR